MTATTLEKLSRQYPRNYITVDQLLADHFPHITTLSHLRRKIRSRQLDIKIQQIDPSSNRSPWIIYLTNLADWLDKQAAASAAA